MRQPSQYEASDFLPRFFGLLFGPEDRVVISRLLPRNAPPHSWENTSHTFPDAVQTALRLQNLDVPNIYFRASAHDGSEQYGATQCMRIRALFLDVDYGMAGHKQRGPFQTADDALGYLLTMPLRPSIAWHTGHGIQAAYLLDQPFLFPPGGGGPESLERFTSASRRLSRMAMSDSTYGPEHAFRIPLTLNSKRHDHPELPDVAGAVLWCKPDLRYTFAQIAQASAGYAADEYMVGEDECGDKPWLAAPAAVDCPYAELPADIRRDIEEPHAERSNTMFGIVGRLLRAGCSDGCIRDALRQGPSFRSYGPDLDRHVDRCLQKLRAQHSVYPASIAPAIHVYNQPQDVHLGDCAPLPPALDDMLSQYARVTGAHLGGRVRQAARFHEHMFQHGRTGVLESPCGSGKSTWALSHIALNAGPDRRYMYVVETIDALYRAAETLEKLTETPVGRVHGFNPAKCSELCGRQHKWSQCGSRHPKSVCHTCKARARCCFYKREAEQQKPIACMTHSGLVRALEQDEAGLLAGACVIVDEQLSPLNTATFTAVELDNLQKCAADVPLDFGCVFPYSRRSHAQELAAWQVSDKADTFASRNYVYRDEQQTAALADFHDALRSVSALGLQDADPFKPGDLDKARETLGLLLNFFRPSRYSDATYAFRESRDAKGALSYNVTRNRFAFDSAGRAYRKLWILNASAGLSPDAYPVNMTVYACPDLPDSSHLLTVHAVHNNPTKTRQEVNVKLSEVLLLYAPSLREHKQVMVATDKNEQARPEIERQLRKLHGQDLRVVWLTRGRIKGSNEAGACTLAYLTGVAAFTTLDDCALRAALHIRRTFPDQPYVYDARTGKPNWRGGMPVFAVLRSIYALRALDELYQAMWRTAVRNDHPAHAILAVPQPDWLVALWRTVAPRMAMGEAVRSKKETVEGLERDKQTGQLRTVQVHFNYAPDDTLAGLRLINMPPGTEIAKQQAAMEFGYVGTRAWERHAYLLQRWLQPFFDDRHHSLRRKPFQGIRLLTHANRNGSGGMRSECADADFAAMLEIINDAAQAYKGAIPADCWHDPYMPAGELRQALDQGIEFWGIEHEGELVGVMGLQQVLDVALIRHAYVRTACRNTGLGGRLLRYLLTLTRLPCLVGTWEAATWAVRFYEKNGFRLVTPEEKDSLLPEYWGVPPRQVATSVVLADERWFTDRRGKA